MKRLIFLLTILMTLMSCKDWLDDEYYTLEKRPYTGSEIKTNGYFYSHQLKNGSNKEGISILVFYKDGTAIDFAFDGDNLEVENDVFKVNPLWLKNNKYNWGLFNIESDTIKIERLNSYGTVRAYMYTLVGIIENDTTICIIREQTSTDAILDVPFNMNQTFHFKEFSPKPDSTNVFIK